MPQDEISVVIEIPEISVEFVDPSIDVEVIPGPDTQVVLAGNTGPPGPKGDKGDQGDIGPSGDASFTYVHDQGIPLSTWSIAHNLDGFPNVAVVDSAGTSIEGDINYIDNNNIIINFSAIFSGKAYLS